MWDDIADKNIAEQTFTDSLNHMFDSLLELRQEELIARERTHGLSNEERLELWTLNQELAKKWFNGLSAEERSGSPRQPHWEAAANI